jgi:hypothetical protein
MRANIEKIRICFRNTFVLIFQVLKKGFVFQFHEVGIG